MIIYKKRQVPIRNEIKFKVKMMFLDKIKNLYYRQMTKNKLAEINEGKPECRRCMKKMRKHIKLE